MNVEAFQVVSPAKHLLWGGLSRVMLVVTAAIFHTPAFAQTAANVLTDAQQGVQDAQSLQSDARSIGSALQGGGVGAAIGVGSALVNMFQNRSVQKAAGALTNTRPTTTPQAVYQAPVQSIPVYQAPAPSYQPVPIYPQGQAAYQAPTQNSSNSVNNTAQAAVVSVSAMPQYQSTSTHPAQTSNLPARVSLPQPTCDDIRVLPTATPAVYQAQYTAPTYTQYQARAFSAPDPEHMRLQELNQRWLASQQPIARQ